MSYPLLVKVLFVDLRFFIILLWQYKGKIQTNKCTQFFKYTGQNIHL